MFYNCKNLKTLDISSFDTSSVSSLQYMFSGCENLVSLDLSNFNLSSAQRINNMFSNCKSLVYLNLDSFEIGTNIKNMTDIFEGISSDMKYCYNETKMEILKNISISQCDDICFQKNMKLKVETKACAESCMETDFKYEYNHLCYVNCPTNTHKSSNNEYLCEEDLICKKYTNEEKSECYDEIMEGYYLEDPMENIIAKCHENCKTCDEKGTQDNNNCKACPNGKFLNFGNCINSCTYGYDSNNICKCPDKCKECNQESYNLNLCTSCKDGFFKKYNEVINNNYIDCYNNPEGYYLDTEYKAYKPCYQNCKNCYGEGNSENNNCIECITNYELRNDFENDHNCIIKSDFYYYLDESNNFQNTTNDKCPQNINKFI
jgi:surface protein